jgi:hypothetical protein
MANNTQQTTIEVFHVRHFGQAAEFPAGFDLVATVTIPAGVGRDRALEGAYHLTQNVEIAWTRNAGVEPKGDAAARGGARSTSVADVLVLQDGSQFRVSPIGFEPIEEGR